MHYSQHTHLNTVTTVTTLTDFDKEALSILYPDTPPFPNFTVTTTKNEYSIGEQITFNLSFEETPPAGYTVVWSTNSSGITVSGNGASATATASTVGSKTVTATVSLNGESKSASKTITITAPLIPGSLSPTSQTIDSGSVPNITHSGASGGTGTYTYTWYYKLSTGSTWIESSSLPTLTNTGIADQVYQFKLRVQSGDQTEDTNAVTVTVTGQLIANTTLIIRGFGPFFPNPGCGANFILEYDIAPGVNPSQISVVWTSDKNDITSVTPGYQSQSGNRVSSFFAINFGLLCAHNVTATITVPGSAQPYTVTLNFMEMSPIVPGTLSLDLLVVPPPFGPVHSDLFPPEITHSGASGGYGYETFQYTWVYSGLNSGSTSAYPWNRLSELLVNPTEDTVYYNVFLEVKSGDEIAVTTNTLTIPVAPWTPGEILFPRSNYNVGEKIYEFHDFMSSVPHTRRWSYKSRTSITWTTLPAGQDLVINIPGLYDIKRLVTITGTGQTKETNTLTVPIY